MHRPVKFLTVVVLFVSSLLWTPAAVAGQRASGSRSTAGPCGPLDDAERLSLLEHYTPLFTSEEEDWAESRGNRGLEIVPSGPHIHVVERPGDCRPVEAAAFRILNREILEILSGGRRVRRSSQNWAVLRFGPYYLVPIYSRPLERVAVQQYGQVLIFAVGADEDGYGRGDDDDDDDDEDDDDDDEDDDDDDDDDLRFLGWFLG